MEPHHRRHRKMKLTWALAMSILAPWVYADTPSPSTEPVAAQPTATETSPKEASPQPDEPDLKPRFHMQVPSLHQAISEVLRSNSGTLVRDIAGIMLDSITRSADGLDHDETLSLIETIRVWPDTSADLSTFAPDIQSRSRWALRLDWPLTDLRTRVQALFDSESAREMLSGITMKDEDGVATLRLRDDVLGYLLATDNVRSMFATHKDLILPADGPSSTPGRKGTPAPLVTARLNLSGTEKDSGATAFSSFSFINALTYSGYVNAEGVWHEQLDLLWPPISGMGIKALFGKVKQTFFVPDSAIGAVALNTSAVPGILDQMAGFGPQMTISDSGEFDIDESTMPGLLSLHGESQLGIVVLPGTGFFPAPDFVIQSRTRNKDAAISDLRSAVRNMNRAALQREARPEWSEVSVDGRPVFWRDSAANARGLLPFAMKPVVFIAAERDAKDYEKDFLVMAFTSTSPEQLVRRWLAFPRTREKHYVPSDSRTSGELWINWMDVYRLVHPYLDLMLNIGSSGALLPHADRLTDNLTHGRLTAQVKYAGLNMSHEGPLPVGVLALPIMFGVSLEPDTSGSSDLAREQFAVQRLKVLHHHSELFRQDLNRWPAELRELDGYVDFAAHPELLRLQLSAGKAWGDWFESLSEEEHPDAEEDEDELDVEFDDDLYVIEWKKNSWSLGYAPDTFEHLEKLYIDQDGRIHRVPAEQKPAEQNETAEAVKDEKEEAIPETNAEDDDQSPKE